VSEGITSVLSALGFLNPGLHLMQTHVILKLEQSSQLLRILLITTTLASLALGHSILATESAYGKEPWTITIVHTNRTIRIQCGIKMK
jgi:hypothetical protein